MNPASDDKLNPTEIHILLGNKRRRLVIEYLSLIDRGVSVEVRHIARIIRSIETMTPPEQVSTKDYESAYNSLIQTHLPKLAAHSVIEYNDQRKLVLATRQVVQYALIANLTKYTITHHTS